MGCWPKVDENETNGEQGFRNITDGSCLFAFSLFWCFMLVVAVFSFTFGDPSRLAHGYDSFGNICGVDNNKSIGGLEFTGLDLSDRPYLFYLNGRDLKNSLTICTRSCPSQDITDLSSLFEFEKREGVDLCRYGFTVDQCLETKQGGLNQSLLCSSPFGPCPVFPIRESKQILNRCIPSDYSGTIHDLLSYSDIAQLLLLDIYNSWLVILGFFFCALVGSSALLTLFYLSTDLTTYLVLVCSSLISISVVGLFWWKYCELVSTETLFECCQSEMVMLVCAIIATILAIVTILLVAFVRCRVKFHQILFQESSEVLKSLPAIFIQPLFTFLCLCSFYVFWIFVMSYLASARYPDSRAIRLRYTYEADSPINTTELPNLVEKNISFDRVKRFTLVEYSESPWIHHTWWICVLGFIWVSEFVLACQQMTIATAVARWYFSGKDSSGKNPVWTSLRYLVLYHMGSAALGSFLITIFKIPRLIVGFLYSKYRSAKDKRWCPNYCLCCFDCFESFMAYIDRDAYTVVGMRGVPFLTGGKRAWIIRVTSKLNNMTDNAHSNVITFLAKVFITGSVGSVAFLFFNAAEDTYSAVLPTVLVSVCSFFISHCVISIFELIIDTLYLCISEDQDINADEGQWKQSLLIRQDVVRPTIHDKPSTSTLAVT